MRSILRRRPSPAMVGRARGAVRGHERSGVRREHHPQPRHRERRGHDRRHQGGGGRTGTSRTATPTRCSADSEGLRVGRRRPHRRASSTTAASRRRPPGVSVARVQAGVYDGHVQREHRHRPVLKVDARGPPFAASGRAGAGGGNDSSPGLEPHRLRGAQPLGEREPGQAARGRRRRQRWQDRRCRDFSVLFYSRTRQLATVRDPARRPFMGRRVGSRRWPSTPASSASPPRATATSST